MSATADAVQVQNNKLKPYPEYKDSGIEWLGRLPGHWEVSRLGHLGSLNTSSVDKKIKEGERLVNLVNYLDVYSNRTKIIDSSINFMKVSATLEQISTNNLKQGDVVFTPSSETVDDIGHSAVITEDLGETLYSYHLVRLRFSKDIDLDFKKYIFNNLFVLNQLSRYCRGTTRKILKKDDFKSTVVVIPQTDEQRAIASFLDRETSKIDALISKKERLIELLEEKRNVLISHTVTKGLDPNVPMMDSGIEWIGEVPEGWEIIRFKFVLWLQRGHDLPVTEIIEGEYPVCGSNGCIGYHNLFTTKGPGVTVGRSGSVGEVNYIEKDYWAHNTALYVKEFRKTIPRYAFYLLKTLDVKYLSEGTAVGTLNRNYIHDLISIAVPVVTEQRTIAAFLDCETSKIDALVDKVKLQIEKLKEYRTALISAAVTGKIDVRGEV